MVNIKAFQNILAAELNKAIKETKKWFSLSYANLNEVVGKSTASHIVIPYPVSNGYFFIGLRELYRITRRYDASDVTPLQIEMEMDNYANMVLNSHDMQVIDNPVTANVLALYLKKGINVFGISKNYTYTETHDTFMVTAKAVEGWKHVGSVASLAGYENYLPKHSTLGIALTYSQN